MPYEQYLEKWENLALSTEPVNRPLAEELIIKFYSLIDLPAPEFKWVDSPWNPDVGAMKIYEYKEDETKLRGKSRHTLDGTCAKAHRVIGKTREFFQKLGLARSPIFNRNYSFLWRSVHNVVWNSQHSGFHFDHFEWWCLFDWHSNEGIRGTYQIGSHLYNGWLAAKIAEQVPWWRPHKDVCLVSERPARISYITDDINRIVISNRKEEAIIWGHKKWYLIDGIVVPDYFVTDHAKVSIKDCLHENAEIRRIALDIFGRDRFIKEANGKVIDYDERYGILWAVKILSPSLSNWAWRRSLFISEEDMYLLEVVNRSPEPDGSFKKYFLKVPPPEFIAREFGYNKPKRTALEAVAWTFGMKWDEYKPEIET